MPTTTLPHAVDRTYSDKFGERVSVLDTGAAGDGAALDDDAFNHAISDMSARGGGEIYMPGGKTYKLRNVDFALAGSAPITLVGDGESSVILSAGGLAAGKGLLNIARPNVRLRNFAIDGGVTVSTNLNYASTAGGGDFGMDPMNAALTTGTSVWVHGGAHNFRMEGVSVRHTGGYSVLLDARNGSIIGVRLIDDTFENNRPFTFGYPGNGGYGAWTGGVLAEGDGVSNAVSDFLARGCNWRRNTGNALWSHLYGFAKMHSNFRWVDNHFEDCGLDAMLLGGVSGATLKGNTGRRIGYITTADDSASEPRWLQGNGQGIDLFGVFMDHSGLVTAATLSGNSATSINGGFIDADGLAYSNVSGNTGIVPKPGMPEYAEDNIASIGPGGTGENWTYGLQTSNSSNTAGGDGVSVTGNTFINLGGGAGRLYAARNCHFAGNNIDHPDQPHVAPIVMGNIGSADTQRTTNTVVEDNRVTCSPGSPLAAVQELSNIAPFTSADKNWVYGNKLFGNGNLYEFYKDPQTNSVSSVQLSSAHAQIAATSASFLQREGVDASAVTALYKQRAGNAPRRVAGMQDYSSLTRETPLWNVSDNGTAGTGIMSTGSRSSLAFDDALWTGRLVGDQFIAMKGKDLSSPDAAADLLDDTWGLLVYDVAAKKWKQSNSAAGGHRVYSDLGGTSGAAVAGADKQIQFNNAGAFGASPNLQWDSALQMLTVTGIANQNSFVVANGYIHSDQGYYSPGTAATTVNVPSGGVAGKWLIASESLFLLATSQPAVSAYGQAKFYMDSGSNQVYLSVHGGGWVPLGSGGSGTPGGADGQVQYNHLGAFAGSTGFTFDGTTVFAKSFGIDNAFPIHAKDTGGNYRAILQIAADNNLYLDNLGTGHDVWIRPDSGRFIVLGNSTGAVIPNGTIDLGSATNQWNVGHFQALVINTTTQPGVILQGQGSAAPSYSLRDSGGHEYRLQCGAASVSDGTFIIYDAVNGRFAMAVNQSGHILFGNYLDDSSGHYMQVNGSVSAAGGFYTSNAQYNAIQAPAGGLYVGLGVTTDQAIYPKLFASATMNPPGGGYGGLAYKGGSQFWYYVPGSGWAAVDFGALGGGGAVTKITAGTGVTVSPAGGTGNVTVAIGQAVNPTSNVVFNFIAMGAVGNMTLDANGNISMVGTLRLAGGAGTGLNLTGNTAYNSIQTVGGVSAAQGFYVGGTTVINSFGHFVGQGVDVGVNGVAGRGFNPRDGSNNQYFGQDAQVFFNASTGLFTINGASYAGLHFVGGIFVGGA